MPTELLNTQDILSFFAVLVRFSVLIMVLPFFNSNSIPGVVKILLSLSISLTLFPMLVGTGAIDTGNALDWGATASSLAGTIALEALFGLALGFTARLVFDAIHISGNIAGTFMGFAAASQIDPHQESQTQVISKFQVALAMLLFLTVDGHHLMLNAALNSYEIVGLGKMNLDGSFGKGLLALSTEAIRTGFQLAAPMAVSLFSVNVVYGIMAKAMPQLNVLILSFSVSALIGLFVLLMSESQFLFMTGQVFEQMSERMNQAIIGLSR